MPLPGKLLLPLFFLIIIGGTILLGPLIYFTVGLIWPIPFHRAMDRALLVSALAALGLSASRMPWAELWPWKRGAAMELLLGYFIAAVSIQAMIGFNLALSGFTSAHLTASHAWGRVLLALVAAALLPFLEETLFRGFLQRELASALGWRVGWIGGAVIFMLGHFLKIPVELDREPVHVWSGASALGAAFTSFGHNLLLPQNAGKVFNLFLIGLILGGVFLRAGTLWVNAGLHGGWILGLLLFTGFTRPIEPPYLTGFGGDILSSLSTTLVLLMLGLWIWQFFRHPSIVPEVPRGTGPEIGPTVP